MQFDFGKNWDSFSRHALTHERIEQARADFQRLMHGIPLKGKSFLDIGFGQGLSLMIAEENGANVVGCDINPKCGEVLRRNRALFPKLDQNHEPPIVIGSILQDSTINELKNRQQAQKEGYDVVHSWGVLHHTGNMHQAIRNAASLVREGGYSAVIIGSILNKAMMVQNESKLGKKNFLYAIKETAISRITFEKFFTPNLHKFLA